MEVQLTKQQAIQLISSQVNRPVSERSFRRWKEALGIETARYYNKFDMFRIWFIADYLQQDRNMNRALTALRLKIQQMKQPT